MLTKKLRLSTSCPSRTPLHAVAWKQSGIQIDAKQKEPCKVLKASLEGILKHYFARTPTAGLVVDKVYKGGYGADQVFHDHFAFRTFGVPGLGIESLGAAFEAFGYTRQDYYTFPRTHLLAAWYAPPKELYEKLPRMFVSQLQVNKLSPEAQAIIHSYTDPVTAHLSTLNAPSCTASTASSSTAAAVAANSTNTSNMLAAWTCTLTQMLPWRTPSREDYIKLLDESEYGAWVLVNGYALNHTALSVHQIAGHQGDIYGFANDLVMKGFKMNESGGIMKVSPDSGLLQCSTVADLVDFKFAGDQVHPIVGAYMEFVERKPLQEHQHLAATGQLREVHRRDGFEADSAKGIFASTTLAAVEAQQQGVM